MRYDGRFLRCVAHDEVPMKSEPTRTPDSLVRLFVYGTLKRSGRYHAPLAAQTFLGVVRTPPRYGLFDLGDYPGLIQDADVQQAVEGELYAVMGPLLDLLDRIEGAPRLFRLAPIELEGESEPAFAYFYQRDVNGHPLCPEGRWMQRSGD
jgi:gamma-glutamylcyclotransferase (GGCT)/AIG2-like uncharacterized protein YtfP